MEPAFYWFFSLSASWWRCSCFQKVSSWCPSLLTLVSESFSWTSTFSYQPYNSCSHGHKGREACCVVSSFISVPCSCFSSEDEFFALSLNFIYFHSSQKPRISCHALKGLMGTSPGDVSCKINKLGIKSVNPDYWPLSPASLLCKQTWTTSFLLLWQLPVRLSRERKWAK